MSKKERERLKVMHRVEYGTLTLKDAAESMGLSYRQTRRIWRRYRKDGEWGMIHRSRGMTSNRRTDPTFKAKVLELYQEKYWDFGPTLAAEKMGECDGIEVNHETLRRWLAGACLWPGRKKASRHRRKRPRRSHFGELVQLDGSPHAWFEGRAPEACLMVMVDDATGRCLASMAPSETTEAAYQMLQIWMEAYGAPKAIYTDCRNIYVANRDANSEEKRQGSGALTDFARACWRLGIEIITAKSPEAKGRVERSNGTHQDRFVKEMRLAGVSDIDTANAMLPDYCRRHNEKFAKAPAATANYHRALPSEENLKEILCWEERRTVQRDWTVSWKGRKLQIERQAALPKRGSTVTVRTRRDGSIALLAGDRALEFSDPAASTRPNRSVTRPHGGGGEKARSNQIGGRSI